MQSFARHLLSFGHKLTKNSSRFVSSIPSTGSNAVDTQPLSSVSPDWDQAMSDAEKIVGYSTSYFSLRCLLSDEISNVAVNLNKIANTEHPLKDTAKLLKYTSDSNMQTRGLIVLLMSKAAGHRAGTLDFSDAQQSAGISQRQRSLAEMTEMIYLSHLIHRGIMNIDSKDLQTHKRSMDLHYGNKMSVLSGDFLLASVWKGLGELRDTKVVELMATAIGDFMEGQFVIETQSKFPTLEVNETFWEERNFMRIGSLQANSCQSALQLSTSDVAFQSKAYDFGRNIALGLQAFTELQQFIDLNTLPVNTTLKTSKSDLITAPIVLHIENNGQPIDEIIIKREYDKKNNEIDIEYDPKKLHSLVRNGPAVSKTRDLIKKYTDRALVALEGFPQSDATNALSNIVFAIREQ